MRRLIADGLSVNRGGRQVVAPLNASLEPGTLTAICGPNGAGKSSLIMALSGLLSPARGEVRLGDARLSDLSAKNRAKALGYLPQGSDIAWDVAVESLVALGRHPHGDAVRGARGAAGRAAIESAIAATAIEGLRHRPASQLSGGERARTLLARVLAGEPDWVLADEPLAALDLAHQLSMIGHLRRCTQGAEGAQDGLGHKQGVVIVLHDLALAMNHADRVLVLQNGRLVADGLPEQALAEPVIKEVWGIASCWLGEPGARALVTGPK